MRAAALSVAALLLLAASTAFAAGPALGGEPAKPGDPVKPATVTPAPIPAAAGSIRIDGIVDDPGWETAWKANLPYEVRPGENSPAPVRTEVLLTFTRDSLSVAFKAHDPDPSQIRAHLTDRDAEWNDDWVGVVLDTFNDERRDYLLRGRCLLQPAPRLRWELPADAQGSGPYQWIPKGRTWFTNLAVVGTGAHLEDQRGNLLSRSIKGQAVYQGPLQSHAVLELGRTREAFMGREFDQTTVYVHNCMQPLGGTSTYVNVYLGDRIDYANVRPGKRVRVAAGIDQRVGRHLQVSVGPSFERMRVEGGRLYTALQGQVSAGYQFTPRVFVRAILQHVDYRYNVALFTTPPDPRSQRACAQVLFSYKVNPRTVWFVGYTDNRSGTDEYVLTQRDRSLFTKVGYAWTF